MVRYTVRLRTNLDRTGTEKEQSRNRAGTEQEQNRNRTGTELAQNENKKKSKKRKKLTE